MNGRKLKASILFIDYLNFQSIEKGYTSYADYRKSSAQLKGFKNYGEMQKQARIDKGLSINSKYKNELAIKKGFKNYSEKERVRLHKLSMSENKNCAAYLGVHIAERISDKLEKVIACCEELK